MEFDGWKLEVGSNIRVFNLHSLFNGHTFEYLRGVARRGDGGPTAESLEDRLLDQPALFVNFDL